MRYLEKQLRGRGVQRLAGVTGDDEDPTGFAWRFSPLSNNKRDQVTADAELRVLLATDVLSEGQNLQDGAIIVNFDLPWAIKQVAFRADAAFAKPEIYEALEERDVKYAIRIPANDNLERDIAELLKRPLGRPSHKPVVWYKGFLYQAASWKRARRVVSKVEFHFGELFPRVGFIVTNLSLPSRAVVRFYNKRGTAEQWIKEGKHAMHWTRLSCHRFRANEARLQLSLLAYNLGNLWRRQVLPKRIDNWSLTSLQQRLVKTGGRLVKHARYYWLLLAESHLTRRLFGTMLRRIWALPVASG